MELLTPNCIPQLKKNNIFFLVVVIACFIYVLLVRTYRTETSFVVFRPPNHAFVISDSQSPKPKQPKAEIGEYTLIPYMSIIEKRFSYKTDGRCDNTCPKTNPACKAKSMNDWRNLASKKQLHGVPLFSPTEYMFPWELQYVKDSPLQDEKTLPSLTKSKIIFESQNGSTPPEDDQNIVLLENVQAKFRVILLDQYGHFRNKGGDEVRAWLTGNKNNTNVAVTADVEDYHNGTYGVFVTVPWTGLAKLHVTVTYTREYIRATLNHHRLGAHRVVIANFIRGDIKEATICHGTPNVPGRPCVCNMTKWNGQAYYCGRPLDKRLSCDDRPRMSMTRFPSFRNLTDAEAMLEKHAGRNPAKAEIQHQLKINVAEGREYPTLPPCFKSSPQLTWKKTHRVGYWSGSDKKVWKSHICREREMTPTWIRKCLKSTTFWMLGDSQIRKMVEHFNNVLECNEAVKKWPYLCHCKNKKLNATFFFRPHQYPLYLSQTGLLFVNNGNETDFLANIPSEGDHVVVLHFYLHFAGSHLSALRLRLRIMKEAVAKLIERNPSVLIFIRGPHTSAVEWSFNHMFGGDVLGAFIRDMYIEIFADLQDKIYFLDAWGMSISIENLKLHPKAYFFKSQWRTILSYKCV